MFDRYYAKLQEELKKYPYQRDYVHTVDNFKIDIPMIYGDASTVMCLMLVDAQKAKKFIHDERIKPILVAPNKTLLAINIFEYRECATGPFNEFTFSIPVTFGEKFTPPLLPLIFDQSFSNFGFYVIQLGASNDLGRKHIIDIWGYPTYKDNLNITLKDNNGQIAASIFAGQQKILSMTETLSDQKKFKLKKKKFHTYFHHDNKLRHVELNTLLFERMWIGKRDFSFEIGDHELGKILKDLDAKQKLVTIYYPRAIEIAGRVTAI